VIPVDSKKLKVTAIHGALHIGLKAKSSHTAGELTAILFKIEYCFLLLPVFESLPGCGPVPSQALLGLASGKRNRQQHSGSPGNKQGGCIRRGKCLDGHSFSPLAISNCIKPL